MQIMKDWLCILAGLFIILAVTVFLPVAAAPDPVSCVDCGMVWKDTCVPFERNNETAYNEESLASYKRIQANVSAPTPDFSNQSWSSAFLAFHNLMNERYAFTRWKSVDFDTLYATYAPVIAAAEKKQDKAAYYRAIRQYLFAIPDGHVDVLPTQGDFGAKYADLGGGFGLTVIRLDYGKVIVSYVANGSAAERAGVRPGDVVTAWNGKKIQDAIKSTSYIWAVKKPSTAEGILLQQQRLLTRAPIGTTVTITFAGSAGSPEQRVNLTAYDDGADTIKRTSVYLGKQINDIGAVSILTDIKPQISNDTLTYRTLPGGYAYIAIYDESYDVYQPFKAAMQDAIAKKAPGVVIDLRYNSGGDDNIASCFAGWFVDKPVFYEYATKYDPGSKKFAIVSEAWTQPQPNGYHGPVAVLVSPDTISSGEGVPMIFANSGTGKIISWYGTNGAFGMNSLQAILPLGLYMVFPDGASLDKNGIIQMDSTNALVGGVTPQVRVPMNEDTVLRAMAGEDVQMTYAMKWLDDQQKPVTTVTPAATATPVQKTPLGIAIAIIALGLITVIAGQK